MEKISYKLDVFEGPLDLLLHLIEKNKLNIYDIQISELLSQYMEQADGVTASGETQDEPFSGSDHIFFSYLNIDFVTII